MGLLKRSLALFLLVLCTHFESTLSRRHRHHHGRDKRQQSPSSYVLDVPGPETGDWGPWSATGPCSRTCGGGVSYQTRECREDSREPCGGASKRYFSCNIQDCPEGSVDFRAEQCASFNTVLFDDVYHTWVPYTKAPKKCELNCMPRGERFYYRHKDKVADGTPCEEEKLDVCVDGKCLPVGCDHLLGSSAQEDQCRECGGDGSSCNTARGLLSNDDLQVGYNDILLIPAGATNIKIQETKPSNNYLAIRNLTGHYFLNGNWRIDYPRRIKACGTIFHYERRPHGFFAPEMISALGPTLDPIYIVLLYQEKNPGIEYEYSIPKGAVQHTDPDSYTWAYNEFRNCNATCGGGVETRNVWCAKRKDSAEVSQDLCDQALEPPSTQECAPEPCPPQWTVSEWSPCTQSCGTGGTQTRQVICEQIISGGRSSLVNSLTCEDSLGPAPPTSQMCGEGPPCPSWHIGPWKPCDKLCGDGVQKRDIVCYRKVDGKIEKMEDGACPGEKPEMEIPCKLRPCEGVDWVTTEWSGCEDKCGLAFETRQAFCTTEKGVLYPDSFCMKSRVPALKRECYATAACMHQWFASQWSQCSAQCGPGVQSRKVFCGSFTDEGVKKTDESMCDVAAKYEDSKNCTGEEECKGNWFSGPWSVCSKPCGGGQRTRKVLCMLNNETVPSNQCDFNVILFSSEDCNQNPCGTDQIITVASDHTVDEDYGDDEDCEEGDYDEDFITTEGVLVSSIELEGSGSSPGLDDETVFSVASDISSFGSEVMLSDGPSSLSTSGLSDTSLLVTFGSSEFTEESGSASPIVSTEFEGSGESPLSTSPSGEISDVFTESSDISSSSSDQSTLSSSEISSSESYDSTTAGEGSSSKGSSEMSSTAESASIMSTTEFQSTEMSLLSESVTLTSDTSDTSLQSTSQETETSNPTETTSESVNPFSDSTTQDQETNPSTSEEISTSETETTTSQSIDVPGGDGPGLFEPHIKDDLETLPTEEYPTESTTDQSISSTESSSSESSTVSSGSISTDLSSSSEDTSQTSEGSTATTEFDTTTSSDSSTLSLSSIVSSDSSETSTVSSDIMSSSSGSTEDTLYTVTSPSYGASTTELISIFSTELTTAAKARKAKKKCKRKPKKKSACLSSEFGCCYDNVTAAQGPFNKGCEDAKTCKETKHGCCEDGLSPAKGLNFKGCPPSQCNLSLFGCCPDGVTEAQGNDFEACPEEPTTPSDCKSSQFGCCPDGATSAAGPNFGGCFECEGSGECDTCNSTKHGCCPDGLQAALGPNFEGCDVEFTTEDFTTVDYENGTDCENTTYGCCLDGIIAASGPSYEGCEDLEETVNCTDSDYGCCPDGFNTATGPEKQGCPASCADQPFGCCQDNITPAHGPNKEGCCLLETFGCCPDNILPAQGPNLEGCGCQYTTYGCCPDNQTAARGADNQGCGCQYTPHGCCPNQYTPAAGPAFQGCPCYTYQFGCCPDGVTRAIGPNSQGCGCESAEFGCCPDGRTPAPGPDRVCPCAASTYGCCPDGISEAGGEQFEGCLDIPLGPGELCTLQKDRGTCRDFTVKWFYDTEYGGCSRFWYGGCEGNENRFKTQDECKQTCVEPPGTEVCYLQKNEGPCDGYYPTWYYDTERKQCGQFVYGGCLGNGNKFETREACEELCVTPETLDACESPVDEGPCQGNFTRWFYDKVSESCSTFNYGGCKGNNNNFLTELACQQKCLQPGRSRDECALPRSQGSCGERLPRWFFDASENRCMPFYYSGCEGNGNRFETREVCEQACPPKIEQHTCLLPALVGECHNYTARWYFDSLEAQCRQFYFGGCGGNDNNFRTQEDCQRSCDQGYEPPPPPPPPQPQPEVTVAPPQPDEPFTQEMCFLPWESGTCEGSITQWFYDSRDGVCKQSLYSGCQGNGNRFYSRKDCESRCGNVQDQCTLPRVVGPCDGVERQFYYDQATDSCFEFDYGGCQGNANRFPTQSDCEQRCRKTPPEAPPTQPPPPAKSHICYLPVDKGPCNEQLTAWSFDPRTGQCQTFIYGGCEGNANRFSSIEQCERQCGIFLGQDVCNVPADVGPCQQQLSKFYYDAPTRSCQEFHYGGCEGSANRFSSLRECESICVHREELIPGQNSSLSYLAICKLPVDSGPCLDGEFTRWAFHEQQQTCVPFTYHGCAGNLNRFKSFKACLDYCIPGYSAVDISPPENRPNEIDVDSVVEKNVCDEVQSTCAELTQCPYGVERWVDGDGCDNCRCYNPCVSQDPQCPTNSTCAIMLVTNPETSQTEFKAVCREKFKRGECPQLSEEPSHCQKECLVDADCSGTAKCCYNGCGTSCLEPASDQLQTQAPETYHPGGSAPEILADTPEVEADEGYFVTLRCTARGNPTPTILWVRGGSTLSATGGRYKFLTDGSLQIVGLAQSDAGEYICVADNGIREPVRKSFHVRVRGPKDQQAEVLGDDSQSIIVSLGSRAVLQCYAYGYPVPSVTWWRGERMLPLFSTDFEQRRDLSLVLHTVTLTSLGPYTCQAYNGKGRAASWTVTLKAVGPVYSPDPNDVTYNQYLVPPPRSPLDNQPHPPVYRPVPPRLEPTLAPVTAATARVYVVPVKTNISMDQTVFPVDSNISIPCDVDGYPVPKVMWYKDNQLLHSSSKIQVSESSRLTVVQANANDTGTYKCVAANDYGSSYSEVNISVEGIYVDPVCTDNTFFADCHLVVKGKYCTHKYYGKFCCKSCTLAGQLPSIGPHLDKLKRRRRSLVIH